MEVNIAFGWNACKVVKARGIRSQFFHLSQVNKVIRLYKRDKVVSIKLGNFFILSKINNINLHFVVRGRQSDAYRCSWHGRNSVSEIKEIRVNLKYEDVRKYRILSLKRLVTLHTTYNVSYELVIKCFWKMSLLFTFR